MLFEILAHIATWISIAALWAGIIVEKYKNSFSVLAIAVIFGYIRLGIDVLMLGKVLDMTMFVIMTTLLFAIIHFWLRKKARSSKPLDPRYPEEG